MMKLSRSLKGFVFPVLSLMVLIGLSGCAKYKTLSLPKLAKITSSPFVDDKSISFVYRVFDKDDCKKYLDRDVIAKGYQPIHITITNSSSRVVYFSRKNISLATVDASDVAQKVHTNTVGRAVGYGAAAVFSCGLFAIPAIVDGIGSAKSNDQLDIDFDKKSLHDQAIEPFEAINGLIFVPVELFKLNFKITLSGAENSQRIVLSPDKPRIKVLYA